MTNADERVREVLAVLVWLSEHRQLAVSSAGMNFRSSTRSASLLCCLC
jgi:hypothetical protein